MINLRNTVLAMTMGLFATGALAQQNGFMQDSEMALVAEELFGGAAVKLEFDEFDQAEPLKPFVPKAKLIYDGGNIEDATEFSVTFTLTRATFAEPVSNTDLMWGNWGPSLGADCVSGTSGEDDTHANADDDTRLGFCEADPAEVTLEREGGGKNTNSVTFKITADAAIDVAGLVEPAVVAEATPYTGETKKIVFALPDLNVSGLAAPRTDAAGKVTFAGSHAMVTATIEQPKSGGTLIYEGIMNGNQCGGVPDKPKSMATISCPVVEAGAVITAISNSGGGGLISLAPTDERSVLVSGDGKAVDPQRAALSTVRVTVADNFGGVRDQDGDLIDGFTGDLSGTLAIRVASDSFGEDDVVYIDTNANKKVDGREAFDMDDGVASDTVPLDGVGKTVYYVPSGDVALKHRTEFEVTANTEFADTDAKMRSAKKATAMLKLNGIGDAVAKAYAIAPETSTDIANVRVTCETSAKEGCNVFLDCKDEAGMNTFGEAGAVLGPNTTMTWQQDDIADALGLDDGWEGRLACDVLSSDDITVQILTRASGVLVNNTATSTGG